MPRHQNASPKRHQRSGANHRAAERALDSVLHPAAEPGQGDVFGDPARLAAHEIRGHLAVLTGYASLLQEGALGVLPPAAGHVLAAMDAKTRAISRLVDDMLEDARFQDGRLHLSLQSADLRQLVERAAAEAGADLPASHSLALHLPDAPLVAEVDPGRLLTILRNLLDNAVKYSPHGGAVECRLQALGEKALISVADSGLGIDAADADLVFRRFGRARASAATISGVGLGLYICRTLARLHGGDVRARPRPAGGSEFLVTLPLRQRAVVEPAPSERRSQSVEGSRAAN